MTYINKEESSTSKWVTPDADVTEVIDSGLVAQHLQNYLPQVNSPCTYKMRVTPNQDSSHYKITLFGDDWIEQVVELFNSLSFIENDGKLEAKPEGFIVAGFVPKLVTITLDSQSDKDIWETTINWAEESASHKISSTWYKWQNTSQ